MARSPLKSAEITITKFSKKGNGLGVTSDEFQRKVETPFTIPGDTVKALLRSKRKGVYVSQLEEVITPSPLRVAPRCAHFGTCGGCRSQHLSYETQIELKEQQVKELFQDLMESDTILYPIMPCDPPWHYRNKMEFSFSGDSSGNKFLGLIIDSSRGKVLNLTECHLVNPWFIEALNATRNWWINSDLKAYHPHSNTGSLRTLTVREGKRTGDRLVMLTVSGNPEFALSKEQLDSFTATLKDLIQPSDKSSNLSIFLRIHQAMKGVETTFYEMLLHGPDHIREILHVIPVVDTPPISLEFSVSPSAFFQPNTMQAERLYSRALQLLEIPDSSIVYDLYCGTGTLGICAAKQARAVIGIELSPEAALDAKMNALKNELYNVDIRAGSASDILRDLLQDKALLRPDVVMVDPPRMGLDEATIQHLATLNAPKLLYISCNPATQAENIKTLQTLGYHLKSLQPVDQFPHTVHIENIAILTKN